MSCAPALRPHHAILLALSSACSSADTPLVTERFAVPHLAEVEPLAKTRPVEAPPPRWTPSDPSFKYVLPADHGIRSDDGGSGHFLAPRAHGKHNGIDFLAPLGTPVLAACSGKARAKERGGYGRTVQLVCELPGSLGGDEGAYASFLYAHLDRVAIGGGLVSVKAGDKLGTVGKTGNARGPKISPHLHLEAIVRESEDAALHEKHSGTDAKANKLAAPFFSRLTGSCLEPAEFVAKLGVRRERRVDPFVLLTCAADRKPDLAEPEDTRLKSAFVKWSAHYTAARFDVDAGPR